MSPLRAAMDRSSTVLGPSWMQVVSIAGVIILGLVGALNSWAVAQYVDIKAQIGDQQKKILENSTDIARIQSELLYIRQGVDDVRQQLREMREIMKASF